MQLSSTLLAFLSASLVSSRSFASRAGQELLTVDDNSVPGDNPLVFCQDPKDYILDVDFVDLSPNPPVPGEKLYIVANGTFSEDVEEGAYVRLQVKWNNFVTLINTKADLCDNLPKIDLECPLKKGDLGIKKDVAIPKQVPKGKYDVFATVNTKDDVVVTCMQGSIVFS